MRELCIFGVEVEREEKCCNFPDSQHYGAFPNKLPSERSNVSSCGTQKADGIAMLDMLSGETTNNDDAVCCIHENGLPR